MVEPSYESIIETRKSIRIMVFLCQGITSAHLSLELKQVVISSGIQIQSNIISLWLCEGTVVIEDTIKKHLMTLKAINRGGWAKQWKQRLLLPRKINSPYIAKVKTIEIKLLYSSNNNTKKKEPQKLLLSSQSHRPFQIQGLYFLFQHLRPATPFNISKSSIPSSIQQHLEPLSLSKPNHVLPRLPRRVNSNAFYDGHLPVAAPNPTQELLRHVE